MGIGILIDTYFKKAVVADCGLSSLCDDCAQPVCAGCQRTVVYMHQGRLLCSPCAAAWQVTVAPPLGVFTSIDAYFDFIEDQKERPPAAPAAAVGTP